MWEIWSHPSSAISSMSEGGMLPPPILRLWQVGELALPEVIRTGELFWPPSLVIELRRLAISPHLSNTIGLALMV